ncbi:MAG: hypothetical protein IPO40_10605 [Fibrobacteres bacterium]|nr:hypothetical protein [Fibrobacterota bacterium]
MDQYSCKLLFQWNPSKDGIEYRTRRLCEERIYKFPAKSPTSALKHAKKLGLKEEFEHPTEIGIVKFQFVGVLELIQLIDYGENSELWYEMKERVAKNGNLNHLVTDENILAAFSKRIRKRLSPW